MTSDQRDEVQRTDASEDDDFIDWTKARVVELKDVIAERDDLAERLKACEGEIHHIDEALARRPALDDKPDRLHKILFTVGEAKRCDQLTAALAQARADVARLDKVAIAAFKLEAERDDLARMYGLVSAELKGARAEVERLKQRGGYAASQND